jgi:hypothetical protein
MSKLDENANCKVVDDMLGVIADWMQPKSTVKGYVVYAIGQ